MSFPRYEKYKGSGMAWLGEVPAHWAVLPIKRCLRSIEQGWSPQCEGFPAEPGQWGVLKVGCVNSSRFNAEENKALPASLDPIPALAIRRGDVLVSRANTRDLVGSVAVVHIDHDKLLLCDKLYRLRTDEDRCEPEFLALYLTASAVRSVIESAATGASSSMLNIGQAAIIGMQIALPPHAEQLTMLAFLSGETAKIDALVEAQRRLIELLNEKRQAVISRAVTKGLNPNVPMKDSGAAWLGNVPAHWDVLRVKAASTFLTSGPRGWSEHVSDDGALFVQSGDLTEALGIDFDNANRVIVADDAEAKRTQLKVGDVLVCITGAKTGKVAVCEQIDEPAYINQHICLIRPAPGLRPSYLGAYLHSEAGQRYFELAQYGLKQGLSLENVKQAAVPVPPRTEQDRIVSHVSRLATELDDLTVAAVTSIALLHERRAALISAAVTGKIDVRSLAPSTAP